MAATALHLHVRSVESYMLSIAPNSLHHWSEESRGNSTTERECWRGKGWRNDSWSPGKSSRCPCCLQHMSRSSKGLLHTTALYFRPQGSQSRGTAQSHQIWFNPRLLQSLRQECKASSISKNQHRLEASKSESQRMEDSQPLPTKIQAERFQWRIYLKFWWCWGWNLGPCPCSATTLCHWATFPDHIDSYRLIPIRQIDRWVLKFTWKSKVTKLAYTSPKGHNQKIHWEQILCTIYCKARVTHAVWHSEVQHALLITFLGVMTS